MTEDDMIIVASKTWHINNPFDAWESKSNPIAKEEWVKTVGAIVNAYEQLLKERD